MLWFKHFSTTLSDPVFCEAEDEFGIVATGVYWRCLELLARADCFTESLVMPIKTFEGLFKGVRKTKLRCILTFFDTKEMLNYGTNDRLMTLFCKNLVDISTTYREKRRHRSRREENKEETTNDVLLMERYKHKQICRGLQRAIQPLQHLGSRRHCFWNINFIRNG